jgi:Ankyrin repeats (3 copies)
MENTIRNVILVAVLSAMCANGKGSRPSSAPAPRTATADFLGAIRNNDLKSIRSQVRRHDLVQATDARGATALMYASLYADPTCVKLLLDKGADTNASDAAGATALMWAAGEPEKVRLLLAHGADVNARASQAGQPSSWQRRSPGISKLFDSCLIEGLTSKSAMRVAQERCGPLLRLRIPPS